MAEDWQLLLFVEKLDEWATRENPSQDTRLIVAAWAMNLHSDPYVDLRPQRGFPDLWFAGIPNTSDGREQVTCTVRINPVTRTVTCEYFTTLPAVHDLDPDPLIDPDEPIE